MQRSTHKCRERKRKEAHMKHLIRLHFAIVQKQWTVREKKTTTISKLDSCFIFFLYFFFHTLSLFLLVDVIFSPFLSYRTFKTHCNRTKVYFGLYSVRRLFIRFYFLCILAHWINCAVYFFFRRRRTYIYIELRVVHVVAKS